MSDTLFAEWAPRYTARGIHVFPILRGSKTPLTEHGFQDASIDPDQIALWGRQFPDANIGIYPGPSQLLVVDADLYKLGGAEAWAKLVSEIPGLENTLQLRTGGGGIHYFYKLPDGVTVGKTEGRLGIGIDTRSNDGYTILPPSVHESGNRYEWVNAGAEIAMAPAELIARLQQAKRESNIPGTDGEKIVSGKGLRQPFLWGRACGMRGNGDDEETIYEALTVLNQNRLVPPKSDEVVRDIARRAAQYAPNSSSLTEALNEARRLWKERKSPAGNGLKKYKLTTFNDIEEREIEWLMPGYLAKGKFSLGFGMEGRGKSYAQFGIAAMITRGEPLPGVELAMGITPGNVLLITYEDDPEDTIKPRLRLCGADMSKVYTIHYEDGAVNWRNVDALEAAIEDIPDLRFVAIDPITSYASGIDESKEIAVREAINPLVKLAFKKKFALLGIKHANKDSKKAIDDRVGGSRGWTALARAVFLVGHDNLKENVPGHTYGGIVPTKGNLVSMYPPLGFEIEHGVFKFTGPDPTLTTERLMPKQKSKDDE